METNLASPSISPRWYAWIRNRRLEKSHEDVANQYKYKVSNTEEALVTTVTRISIASVDDRFDFNRITCWCR